MSSPKVYIDNDNVLELDGLRNAITLAYINDATVAVTLVEASSGDEVVGETWPKTMSYVADSDGKYRATLKDTLTLAVNTDYTAQITADGGAGLQGDWDFALLAIVRT